MSSSTKEIYSIIDRLEAKLNGNSLHSYNCSIERQAGSSNEALYRSNFKSFPSSYAGGRYYEDQLSKTYQQMLPTGGYVRSVEEASKGMTPSSEYELRKMIKEEFNAMMIPFQQDINKTISYMETKLDSIEVLKGIKANDQSATLSLQIEKAIDAKVKEVQKEFNAKIEEQMIQISQLTRSQKDDEEKQAMLKDSEEIKANVKSISNEVKGIKEGNYAELKALNTKSLKVIDFDQLSKCDLKTLSTLDLFQLKDNAQGKQPPSLPKEHNPPPQGNDQLKEMKEKISDLTTKVNECIEVGISLKKMKVNEKFSEVNTQITQLQSLINDIQSSVNSMNSSASFNKPSSTGIGFDEINKINQQILGLKQQVNGMQTKQSFFIEASALEAVSNELKKKISLTDYHEAINQLKSESEAATQAFTELKAQFNQSYSSSQSFDKEKEDIIKLINTKIASIPSQEAFDEEEKKVAQLENRIFILENAEKELASVYAQKDDIKFLLDELDKINEKLIDGKSQSTKQVNAIGIEDILSSNKPFFKEEDDKPVMITNIPKQITGTQAAPKKMSPFAMAEKDEVIDEDNADPNEFLIEKAKVDATSKGDSKPKKEHDPDDFDDFEVDDIEELNQ